MKAPLVIAALLLALVAPPARAATDVQLADGTARVEADPNAPNPIVEHESASLPFIQSASSGSSFARQESTVEDSAAGITLNSVHDLSSSDLDYAYSSLVRRFTVTGASVPIKLTGLLEDTETPSGPAGENFVVFRVVGGATLFEFQDSDDGDTFSATGQLGPGTYELQINGECSQNAGNSCSADVEARLDLGEVGAPGVVIQSGPSGPLASRIATFGFVTDVASPPPGRFQCRIDDFGFADCTSPKSFTNLPDGEHVFGVRYVTDGGATGAVSERRFTVGCPDVSVGVVKVQGCFTERLANGVGTGVFETDAEAWIGGFHVVPRPGGKLVVRNDPSAPFVAEGAGVDWVLGPVVVDAPLDDLKPFVGDFMFSLGTAGTLERFAALPFIKGLSAQLKVTWTGGGTGAKVETSVSMEELTKNLGKPLAGRLGLGGTSIGTLAAKLGLTFTNGKPAEVADGELEVPEFAVELKGTEPPIKEGFGGAKFKAVRVGDTVEWSAEVTMLFPWQGNQGIVKGRLFFRAFEIAGGGLSVSGFERPIGKTGWDFTGVEGDILYRPSYSFNVGITAMTHSSFAGVKLLKLTGNVKVLRLAEADCGNGKNPVEFVGTFNSPAIEEADAGEFKGQLLMCAYLQGLRTFAFEAGLSGELVADVGPFAKLFSASGSAKGWFSGTDFNLDGSYRLTAPVIGTIGADGVISSEGYAICGRVGFISAGIATNNWLQAPEELVGCDFTPFRAAIPSASARTAQAARTIRVPAGQSTFGFAIRGTTGAPRVRITGPGGLRFTSPLDGWERKGSSMSVPINELKTTYVYLRKPRAGSWRIVPLDGARIRRIETARELPRPSVRARVRRRGAKVQVTWRATKAPGRTIELVDRTADGTATTIQKATTKASGRVTFTPANPLATRRTIEAVILQNGSPRPPLTAARYRLTLPRRPGRITRPTAKRGTSGLAIAWRKAARARDYLITVKAGAEVLTRTTTTRLKLTYAGAPAGTLTIEITPRDSFGRPGPTATLRAR